MGGGLDVWFFSRIFSFVLSIKSVFDSVIRENRFGEIHIFESVFFERGETTLGNIVCLLFDSTVCHISVKESDNDVLPVEALFDLVNFRGGIAFLDNNLLVAAISM